MNDSISMAAASLGRKGGKSRSEAKRKAAQRNGSLGGRPTKPKDKSSVGGKKK